jgi:bla regulator protein BlaR1
MTFHQTLAEWSRWIWPLIANHLWQTTLFLLVAWMTVLLLNQARVRYFIWMIALVKFLLPSALFIWALEGIGLDLSRTSTATYAGAKIVSYIAQPIFPIINRGVAPPIEPVVIAAEPEKHPEIYCLLSLFWGLGAAAFLGRWLARRWRFGIVLKGGTGMTAGREAEAFNRARSWLLPSREIRLVVVPGFRELGVWRVWRPVVILPEGLAEHLSDEELESVMMHELVHVMRHDNLMSAWQMLLSCLFWFHPLIWLIDQRSLAEREVICDEAVIRYGGILAKFVSRSSTYATSSNRSNSRRG